MSLMADVSGESNPTAGSERERRASLLLDLAAFVEEGEDGVGAGFDSANTFAPIGEGDEGEEDEDDFDSAPAAVDYGGFDDVDILGTPSGDTDLI